VVSIKKKRKKIKGKSKKGSRIQDVGCSKMSNDKRKEKKIPDQAGDDSRTEKIK
jgi:hypothetical protein